MSPKGAPVVQEVRYAVVMYGGISLAIYMNGIAQELLSLVKATAPGEREGNFRYEDAELDEQGSSAVYRDLARFLIRRPVFGTVAELREHPAQLRFNVDILSGTSAGGINGMFLAKALANGVEDLKVLERMWIEEGDISLLLNDKQSLKDLPVKYKKIPQPTSLLNSDRMYHRLHSALRAMDDKPSPAFTSRVDLFMTATDLRGLTKKIQLSDREVEERKYNTVFHFEWQAESKQNDFLAINNPFLGFVARCTSCIVPAFEPMRLEDIERTAGTGSSANDAWSPFFSAYWREQLEQGIDPAVAQKAAKEDFRSRSFGDGGYLDNRPFTYATKTLALRPADIPVRRKLLYVEPDPVDLLESGPEARPNVLDHAVKALTLAGNEAIRDDLDAIRRRNELLDRMSRIIEHVEASAKQISTSSDVQPWRVDLDATPASDKQRRSPAQLGYMHLRVASVTDHLAAHVAKRLGFDEDSVYRSCIRYLVKHWRDSAFEQSDASVSESGRPTRFGDFLGALDFGFEERRIQFLHRKINRIVMAEENPSEQFSMDLLEVKLDLNKLGERLRDLKIRFLEGPLFQAIGSNSSLNISLRELSQILKAPTDHAKAEAARAILEAKPSWLTVNAELKDQVATLREELKSYQRDFDKQFKDRNEHPGPLQGNFSHYELFDELILPITYGTGAIESNYVEIHRISPLDAPSLIPGRMATIEDHPLMRQKLVGTSLGHFGAFFDRGGRARDILWGRLDAAERLITTLMPAPAGGRDFDTERQHFVRRAQISILCDAPTVPESENKAKTAAEQRDMDRLQLHLLQKILDRPLAENADSSAVEAWIDAGRVMLSDAERRRLACTVFELLRRRTDPLPEVSAGPRLALTVDTPDKVAISGRATAILGSLFDGLYSSPRWHIVSWAGSVLAGIGQVLVPGSFDSALGRHWYWLAVSFAGAITMMGAFTGVDGLLRFGLLGIVVLILVGGVMRWLRGLPGSTSIITVGRKVGVIAAILALGAFFGVAAYAVNELVKQDPLHPYRAHLSIAYQIAGWLTVAIGLFQFAIRGRRKE